MRYEKGGMRTGIMSDIQVVNESKTARHNGETYPHTRLHLNFYQDKFITLVRRTLKIREILHSSFRYTPDDRLFDVAKYLADIFNLFRLSTGKPHDEIQRHKDRYAAQN